MSSVECLREFVNERLTAAAEEIFGVFEITIVECEEEIVRQRRLLDIFWKPEIKLHRIELPQQHVCTEEEVLADQQLCIQERNSSLDQEDPEPPQIKEEQEELCTSQEGEQLVLKQETDAFMFIPTDEESDHSQTIFLDPDKNQSAAETELPASLCITWLKNKSDRENSEVSEPNSDRQLVSHNSHVAKSQDQERGKHEDSGSTRDAEPELKKRLRKSNHHTNNGCNPTMLKIHCNTHTGEKSFKCDNCGKAFNYKSKLQRYLNIHTGEKPNFCSTCGKIFIETSALKTHIRNYTGEKPYSCKMCGKGFRFNSGLLVHMRIHTGEKPYTCKTCGKDFSRNGDLTIHMRRAHTGEKPYLCTICGKRYFDASHLAKHRRSHTGK